MGYLQPVKTTYSYGVEIWQTVLETAQGGFSLDPTGLTLGDTIPAGTPIVFDEATRKAKIGGDTDAVKGLLYEDVTVAQDAPITVVIRGTVYARRIPAVSNTIKAKIPNIIFSQSY